mgnify:CR=1 FL=1
MKTADDLRTRFLSQALLGTALAVGTTLAVSAAGCSATPPPGADATEHQAGGASGAATGSATDGSTGGSVATDATPGDSAAADAGAAADDGVPADDGAVPDEVAAEQLAPVEQLAAGEDRGAGMGTFTTGTGPQPVPPRMAPDPAPRPENVRIEELEPSQLTEFVRRMQAGHLLVSLRQLANRVPPGSGLTPPEACPAVIQGMSPRHDMVAAVTPYPTLNDALSERFGEPMCLYWVSWYAAPPPAFLGRALVDGHTFVRAHVVRTTAWIGRTA